MTLLEALLKVRALAMEDFLALPSPQAGICTNVMMLRKFVDEADDRLDFTSREWPEYSGNFIYPVPSWSERYTPKDAYRQANPTAKWSAAHPYGAARLRLLDFLI